MLTNTQLLELYYFMKLNRMVEERLVALYKQGKIVGSLFSSLGQEATSVGSAYALEHGDFIGPMIRNLGSLLVRGYTSKDIFAQYLARATGPSGGKDSNTHFGDISPGGKGAVCCISMLGTMIPVMAGIALAAKMKRDRFIAITWIGDGGTSTTDFHEGCNLAAVMKLPLIVVVEHNGWAYSTPTSKQMNVKDMAVRAKGYGMPGYIVDGNDVLEVYRVTKKAADDARAGKGPSMIEAKTFRRKGHAEHDPADYVPREELAAWEKKDPIDRYERYLLSNEIMSRKEQAAILARIAKELDEAVEFAEKSPQPDGREAMENVYADVAIPRYPGWMESWP